jgi:RND superfamily putative drug exporter
MAVLMDATLVRGLLVPSFMRLAGDANWWAPRSLRKVYERFGFHEGEEVPMVTVAAANESEERVPVDAIQVP